MKDPQNKQPGGMQIIIGVVVVLVILFIASRFLGGSQASETPAPTSQPDNQQVEQNNSDSGLNLGSVVVAENVDRDGCAVDVTDRFDDNATVYAVLGDSAMPEGTRIFARLYHDDVSLEETSELTTEEDYTNVCVNFAFDPPNSTGSWDSGDYEVEFVVNGNSYQSATFTVR